jgi:hypothetical protein
MSPGAKLDGGIDHTRAIRPAIDKVSQQYNCRIGARPCFIVSLDLFNQSLKQIETAMNVANSVDAFSSRNSINWLCWRSSKPLFQNARHGGVSGSAESGGPGM